MVGWATRETCVAIALHLLFGRCFSFQPIAHRIGLVRQPTIASRGLVAAPPPYSSLVVKSNEAKMRHVAKLKRTEDEVKAKTCEWKAALQIWWKNTSKPVASWMRFCRRSASRMLFALVLVFALSVNGAWAVSAGRMGGSFGPSTSSSSGGSAGSSYSRSYSGSSYSRSYAGPSYSRARSTVVIQTGPRIYTAPTEVSLADTVLLVGAGGLITYGLFNTLRDGNGGNIAGRSNGPLGAGATVASVIVSLNVPDRDDPKSILSKLKRLSETCDTSTRKGVQDLISEVSLELLRQEKSIASAKTTAKHFTSAEVAQRQFQRQSVQGRSIFDRETVNKFGSEDRSELSKSDKVVNDPFRATSAIVSLTLAIEGDSTILPKIRMRSDLMEALSQLASDAQVGDCLLSGEILWAPEDRGEILTSDEIYVDYPDLIPL